MVLREWMFASRNLYEKQTRKKFFLVRQEGTRSVKREMRALESDFDKAVKQLGLFDEKE